MGPNIQLLVSSMLTVWNVTGTFDFGEDKKNVVSSCMQGASKFSQLNSKEEQIAQWHYAQAVVTSVVLPSPRHYFLGLYRAQGSGFP